LQPAYDAFQQSFQIDPQTTRPEINMGLLYEEQYQRGKSEMRASAKRAMEKAVVDDPDMLATRLAVTHWALDACELDMAEENAEAALRLGGNSVEALLHAALVARHRGDAAKATLHLQQAHLLTPGDASILMQMALASLESGTPEAAKRGLDYAQLAAAVSGDATQAMGRDAAVTLAWALRQTGRVNESAATAQTALQSGPLSAESSYYAAVIFEAAGRPDIARQLLTPVLKSKACFPTRAAAQKLFATLEAKQ
jgi:tetratricopeptide (TPR) repeat protein